MEENYNKAMELIKNSNKIYIVSHLVPDGDAIGSSYAMYHMIKNLDKNKKIEVLMPKYADRYEFLEDVKNSKPYIEENEIDLLICVDSSDYERVAILPDELKKAKKTLVIDHHTVIKDVKADVKIINNESPATCEIIYEFFENQNIKITKDIAKYIYMGILTDTGSFNYKRTTPKTHRIVANLIETGIDFENICIMLNDTIKEGKLRLIGRAIENMQSFYNGKVRYTKVEWNDINNFGLIEEEADGVTNNIRSVAGTEVAIYVRELQNGDHKVSLRSKYDINVAEIAASYGGGGHIKAAGFTIHNDVDEVMKEVIELIGVKL
ncbi:MAG: bifunctional oligoribonuclease/PAP phosphatase NrnA [Clostridia bacterium]|nr:bifunctional oligoribonuclease/PAP phosphatase NrnA [Clostridia bacterium]MDD4376287.1 bifunctional oligoribonuclease/PAP phosphatase NrnA [Clostridia bacterium]